MPQKSLKYKVKKKDINFSYLKKFNCYFGLKTLDGLYKEREFRGAKKKIFEDRKEKMGFCKQYPSMIEQIENLKTIYFFSSSYTPYNKKTDYELFLSTIDEDEKVGYGKLTDKQKLEHLKNKLKNEIEYYKGYLDIFFLERKEKIDLVWGTELNKLLLKKVNENPLNIISSFLEEVEKENRLEYSKLIDAIKDEKYTNWKWDVSVYIKYKLNNYKTEILKYNDIARYYEQECVSCERIYHPIINGARGDWVPSEKDYKWCQDKLCNLCYSLIFKGGFILLKTKTEMLKDLKNMYNILGYIPPSRYSFEFQKEILALPINELKKILPAFVNMVLPEMYKVVFGSWFNALLESGVLEEGTRKTGRGTMCLAKDGCICLSLAEKKIDDWLYHHKIRHKKEPKYPKDNVLNPNEGFRADWKVGDTLIEFFGLKGTERYDQKSEVKRQLCKKHNINLIELHQGDLNSLSKKLSKKLI